MRIRNPLSRLARRLRRRARPSRGPERLAWDLRALERIASRPTARRRLEAELGRPLLVELDRLLELDGRLAGTRRPRRGLRDAA